MQDRLSPEFVRQILETTRSILKKSESSMAEKDCFVIAPIGEAESETRKRSDQILKHVITPALRDCGQAD